MISAEQSAMKALIVLKPIQMLGPPITLQALIENSWTKTVVQEQCTNAEDDARCR
jgi:hypothetical protein